MKDGPLSPAELRTAIGIQHRQTFRENYLNPAICADLICTENGLSPHDPRIRYALTDRGTSALNEVAENTGEVAEKVSENTGEVAEKVSENTGEVAEKVAEKQGLNDTEKKIVALIRENSHITQRKLSEMIGLTRQYVGRGMDSLQARQIIRRIGPDKGGEWMIVNDNVR